MPLKFIIILAAVVLVLTFLGFFWPRTSSAPTEDNLPEPTQIAPPFATSLPEREPNIPVASSLMTPSPTGL